ncbi:hypothetical protein OAB63_01290 [Alphaproteobacteria bacterium]|nr:hypothetical protein [Alphaproteobacteria bacterium]
MNWFMIIMSIIAIAMFFVIQYKSDKYKKKENKIKLFLALIGYLVFVYYFDTSVILS